MQPRQALHQPPADQPCETTRPQPMQHAAYEAWLARKLPSKGPSGWLAFCAPSACVAADAIGLLPQCAPRSLACTVARPGMGVPLKQIRKKSTRPQAVLHCIQLPR